LVGPNGCGKTSLLNIINGFTPSADGSILFHGQEVSPLSVEQRAKQGIGRVFQSFGVFRQLTLYENLATAYVTKLHRKYKFLPLKFLPKHYKEEIDTILHELDLYEKRHELAGNLS
jgi:ABC-type branched-subunit amino acid transport system ATPase component